MASWRIWKIVSYNENIYMLVRWIIRCGGVLNWWFFRGRIKDDGWQDVIAAVFELDEFVGIRCSRLWLYALIYNLAGILFSVINYSETLCCCEIDAKMFHTCGPNEAMVVSGRCFKPLAEHYEVERRKLSRGKDYAGETAPSYIGSRLVVI